MNAIEAKKELCLHFAAVVAAMQSSVRSTLKLRLRVCKNMNVEPFHSYDDLDFEIAIEPRQNVVDLATRCCMPVAQLLTLLSTIYLVAECNNGLHLIMPRYKQEEFNQVCKRYERAVVLQQALQHGTRVVYFTKADTAQGDVYLAAYCTGMELTCSLEEIGMCGAILQCGANPRKLILDICAGQLVRNEELPRLAVYSKEVWDVALHVNEAQSGIKPCLILGHDLMTPELELICIKAGEASSLDETLAIVSALTPSKIAVHAIQQLLQRCNKTLESLGME